MTDYLYTWNSKKRKSKQHLCYGKSGKTVCLVENGTNNLDVVSTTPDPNRKACINCFNLEQTPDRETKVEERANPYGDTRGKNRRRRFVEREVIKTLILQGAIIPCGMCRVAFTLGDVVGRNIQRDHTHPHKLDGEDTPENCQYLHQDPCHKKKTDGTKATTYGSDKHAIAKAKRIAKGGKTKRGPKIKSRGFQTNRGSRYKQKFDGTTETRK